MSYRNKTYVAFASEDIGKYRLMEAWRENANIDFDFYDAHDLYISRDTSQPETIKRNLREQPRFELIQHNTRIQAALITMNHHHGPPRPECRATSVTARSDQANRDDRTESYADRLNAQRQHGQRPPQSRST